MRFARYRNQVPFIGLCLAILWPIGSTAATPIVGGEVSRFIPIQPCPFPSSGNVAPERLHCGYLEAPMDRQHPEAGKVRLPVAIIRSRIIPSQPDPVVFIAGGPGAAPVASARTLEKFAAHRFGENRDIILFSQRGSLGTTPELRCDRLRDQRQLVYLEDHDLKQRDRAIRRVATDCLRQLRNQGLPPGVWSSAAIARDLRDLRQSLGLSSWNLLAVSYGTLIAQEVARVDAKGVRSMVLDSLVSPESDLFMSEAAENFSAGIERVLQACAKDTTCQARFPQLRDSLDRVLERLREHPLKLVIDGGGDTALDMVVNWHDFLGLTHWMLYSATTLDWIPVLIDETDQGRFGLLQHLLSRVFPAPALAEDAAAGAFFAVVCRDQYRPALLPGAEDDHFGGYALTSFMGSVCAAPGLDYGDFPLVAPLVSDVPTLLLSGNFDLITPPRYASRVLEGLSRGVLAQVPNYGHSTLSGYTACQTDVAAAFFNHPESPLDMTCLEALPPPQFTTDAGVILAP